MMQNQRRKGIRVGTNWGTDLKGYKVFTATFAPGAASRAFVTSGTLPTTTKVSGLVRTSPSLRTTSGTQAMAQVTTDTTTIILDANAATTFTFDVTLSGT